MRKLTDEQIVGGGEASIRLNRASILRKASVGPLNLAVLLAATFVFKHDGHQH